MRRAKLARTPKGRKSTFGCVFKLQRRDGSDYENWSARWVQGDRRVQRGRLATKDAAEDFLARQRVEQSERRALGLPELRRVSVDEGIERYLAWSKEHRRLGTHKSNSTYLTALAAMWGGCDLISLTGNAVVRALEETCTRSPRLVAARWRLPSAASAPRNGRAPICSPSSPTSTAAATAASA